MDEMDPAVTEAVTARDEGRYDDALGMLTSLLGQVERTVPPPALAHFIMMFEWRRLVEDYPPAHAALARERDDQVRRLLEGDDIFGDPDARWPKSRFRFIIEMNQILKDPRSTYEVFVQLLAVLPARARREATCALPAIVECGNFSLAEQYMTDPLTRLDELNGLIRDLPLWPPNGQAPRLAAELSNYASDVVLRGTVLAGLGRDTEAGVFRSAAIAGIADENIRQRVVSEIAVPGTITSEMTSRQMESDADRTGGG